MEASTQISMSETGQVPMSEIQTADPSGGSLVTTSSEALNVEEALIQALEATSEELQHTECFDSEERAELYTILKTLIADTQTHQQIVGQWVPAAPKESSDA